MIGERYFLKFAGLLQAIMPAVFAQDLADRHPVYDAASPRTAVTLQQAKQLRIAPATERRLTVGQTYPFNGEAESVVPLKLAAWRGERCSAQLAVAADGATSCLRVQCSPLRCGSTEIVPTATMIRYTAAGKSITADVIGHETESELPANVLRGVWFSVDVPQTATAGLYTGTVTVTSPGCEPVVQHVQLQVVDATLPQPADWKMHLDLWQHPQAVARWHDVEPWSPEHFALLRPIMKRLAEAGQKCITCTLLDEAWNGQTYDTFPSMIRWVRGRDGKMRYDYSALDAWITFMHDEIGIREQISCYSMLPWHLKVRCFDEATGQDVYLSANPKKPEFADIWAPFLRDFHKHMQERGWAGKTCIAIDERPDAMVRAAMKLLKENAPSFRIASAVDKPSALTDEIYNISPVITHAGTALGDLLRERKSAGKKTTFYVCLHPQRPNTFTNSVPAEAEWLGYFAAANQLDGFLRWAYNSWNRNPLASTDFGTWPSGDCFLVYPGNRSSIRFERLRDGIEQYEKINLLRSRAGESPAAAAAVLKMNERLLALFSVERSKGHEHAQDVELARRIVDETLSAINAQ